MKVAVYAGTFDPLTQGHWSMLMVGAKLFDRLIVGIGKNPGKNPMFTAEERKSIIENSIIDSKDVDLYDRIDVEIFEDEFLVEFAKRKGAGFILRGLRDSEDFRQEQAFSFFNNKFAPEIQAVYLMPDPQVANVSSSAVKGMIGPKNWQEYIKPFLTNAAYEAVLDKKS